MCLNYFLQGTCAEEKMSSFSITRKKTPFQKHREEEEAKKKVGLTYPIQLVLVRMSRKTYLGDHIGFCLLQRAEDETARLYAEFVESFQGDIMPGSKTFVRGGTINPNEKLKDDSEGQYV